MPLCHFGFQICLWIIWIEYRSKNIWISVIAIIQKKHSRYVSCLSNSALQTCPGKAKGSRVLLTVDTSCFFQMLLKFFALLYALRLLGYFFKNWCYYFVTLLRERTLEHSVTVAYNFPFWTLILCFAFVRILQSKIFSLINWNNINMCKHKNIFDCITCNCS